MKMTKFCEWASEKSAMPAMQRRQWTTRTERKSIAEIECIVVCLKQGPGLGDRKCTKRLTKYNEDKDGALKAKESVLAAIGMVLDVACCRDRDGYASSGDEQMSTAVQGWVVGEMQTRGDLPDLRALKGL